MARRTFRAVLEGGGLSPYQADDVLRLIEQMAALIRRAVEKSGIRDAEEPHEVADRAIGLALDMDPTLASRLSPQSLVSLLTPPLLPAPPSV